MNKRIITSVVVVLVVAIGGYVWCMGNARRELVNNPDPNHTHADFAVWINGEKLDFSGRQYMSGFSTDASHDQEEGNRKYLHLHDGIGYVIHRHKPGLTVGEFFDTIAEHPLFRDSGGKLTFGCLCPRGAMCKCAPPVIVRMYVNGKEYAGGDAYAFQDGDHILITDSTSEEEVQRQLRAMTDDACKYSKTCPWKGDPPTENCIADPEVPCVVQ